MVPQQPRLLFSALVSLFPLFAQSGVPIPTATQLAYQSSEIMMLVHFNMGTYTYNGDPSCTAENWNVQASYADGLSSDPELFGPGNLDVDNWVATMKALGAGSAVLTAKHGCVRPKNLNPTKTCRTNEPLTSSQNLPPSFTLARRGTCFGRPALCSRTGALMATTRPQSRGTS